MRSGRAPESAALLLVRCEETAVLKFLSAAKVRGDSEDA